MRLFINNKLQSTLNEAFNLVRTTIKHLQNIFLFLCMNERDFVKLKECQIKEPHPISGSPTLVKTNIQRDT